VTLGISRGLARTSMMIGRWMTGIMKWVPSEITLGKIPPRSVSNMTARSPPSTLYRHCDTVKAPAASAPVARPSRFKAASAMVVCQRCGKGRYHVSLRRAASKSKVVETHSIVTYACKTLYTIV
jgi:hypothetical protein